MIKNLSVNVKGFIAFGLLAAIAIGACTLIFTRSVVATRVVEENVALFEIISASDEVMEQVVEANLALKNFLLTGDRSRVDRYQEVSDSIDADLAALEGTYTETAPEQLALVRQAAADLNSWRQTVVERQIDLMRNPMTVDMARAIELTGEGSRMLEAFYGNLGQAVSALETRAGAGAERQMQVLSAVETISLLASVVVAFGAVLLAFLNFRMVSRPLAKLAAITQRLADGDLDVTIEKSGKDEIGRMADAMEIFREGAIANRKLEREAEENRRQAEADRLAAQERAEADAAERLRIATSGLAGGLKRLAAGDLACRLEEKFAPDFEDLRHDFNRSVEQLGEALRSVAEGVSEMERGTREIAAGSDNLSRRTENQAASLEETAAAVEQITANVASSSKRTEEARLMAVRATESAAHSAEVVTHAEQAIHKIEESSEQIANIIGVIDDIAFQTNLLALNAGVEAARAGEAGKGFAVVAQEVRELAQRSASAAKEIRQLISKSTGEVSSGVNLVRDAGEALRTIGKFIVEMNDHIEAINTSAKEQATGLTEVNQSVNAMDQMTQQNAAMVEQSNAATAALADGAAKLRELVTRFNLGGPVSATGASGENLREMSRSMARSWPEAAAASRPAAGKPKAAATAPASSASPKPASAARSAAAPAGATAAAAADADWEEF